MDSDDWAIIRVSELHRTMEDEHALVGFLRTTLAMHRLGPFAATVTKMPVEACVVRSNGTVERMPKTPNPEYFEHTGRGGIEHRCAKCHAPRGWHCVRPAIQ